MIHKFLFKETNASTLSLFRIFFGALMIYQMIYYFKIDYVFQFMAGPEFLFDYPLLPFFVALPEGVLHVMHFGLLISAVLIMLGLFYRYAMAFFFIVITYFSFIDKTLYNNHMYLISLISFVMIFMEADNRYSLKSSNKKTAAGWNLGLLQFLMVLVYFYGGLAKLNVDWLNGNIPTAMVEQGKSSGLLYKDALVGLLSYGGVAFDLLIGFMLLWGRTRWLGFVLVIAFNLINAKFLFEDIGVFPYFMICATILFFDPEKVSAWISKVLPESKTNKPKNKKIKSKQAASKVALSTVWSPAQKRIAICIGVFVVFHLIWPFRSHLMTSNPEWTGHGSRFAWRMKMQTKKIDTFKMTITDGPNGTPQEIDYKSFLSVNQLKHLVDDPSHIVQFAKYLREKAIRKNMAKDPIIKATVMVEYNKRPSQLYIDPNVDLTKVDLGAFADYDWIMPLQKIQE